MLNKICFFIDHSPYESKRYFTTKLTEALNRQGIETRIIKMQDKTVCPDLLNHLKRYAPDLTASFTGLPLLDDGRYISDFLTVPHWSILIDPAVYSMQYTRNRHSIISCVDQADEAYLRSNNFSNVFFCPHAVEKDIDMNVGDRIYDVVFPGTCYDYEGLRVFWRQRHSKNINKILDDAIHLILSDKTISITEALTKLCREANLPQTEVDFRTLFQYLDIYTRGKDRIELIRSIKDAQIHIFGDADRDSLAESIGWKSSLGSQENVTIHPSVPYWEYLNILKQSKICLDSCPFFKQGSHARVPAALACGAVPVATDSLYLREFFTDGLDVLYYSSQDRSDINSKINDLLTNEKKRIEMAKKGRDLVLENHTWENRVEDLLGVLPRFFSNISN